MTGLVLIPGLGADARMWAPQVAALPHAQVTQAHRAHPTIAAIAGAVLAEAPQRFALAAASMGGYVALEVMRQAPSRVARLALLNSSARADTAEQRAARLDVVAAVRKRGVAAALETRLRLTVHPRRLGDAALVGVFHAMAEATGAEAYVRQMQAAMDRIDSRPFLPAIACPTLVLAGSDDVLLPAAHSEEIAAAVPGARLVVLDDCGHCANLEQPDAVNAAMKEWLAA